MNESKKTLLDHITFGKVLIGIAVFFIGWFITMDGIPARVSASEKRLDQHELEIAKQQVRDEYIYQMLKEIREDVKDIRKKG